MADELLGTAEDADNFRHEVTLLVGSGLPSEVIARLREVLNLTIVDQSDVSLAGLVTALETHPELYEVTQRLNAVAATGPYGIYFETPRRPCVPLCEVPTFRDYVKSTRRRSRKHKTAQASQIADPYYRKFANRPGVKGKYT